MTDLVVMSLEGWDDVWRRNQHLVAGLLKTDPALRVLFVEPAADPLHDVVSRRRPPEGGRSPRSPASRPAACGGTDRSSGCPDASTPTPTNASHVRSCEPRESEGCRNPCSGSTTPAPSPCR